VDGIRLARIKRIHESYIHMSNSIAAAKKRRAGGVQNNSPLFKSNGGPQQVPQRQTPHFNPNVPTQFQPNQGQHFNPNVQPNQVNQSHSQPTNSKKPMNLQQVIAVFDKRILYLESRVQDHSHDKPDSFAPPLSTTTKVDANEMQTMMQNMMNGMMQEAMTEFVSEYDHRYDVLANEIHQLKDMVMKLQTYTMDVNKMLIDERSATEAEQAAENAMQYVLENTNLDSDVVDENDNDNSVVDVQKSTSDIDNLDNMHATSDMEDEVNEVSSIQMEVIETAPEKKEKHVVHVSLDAE